MPESAQEPTNPATTDGTNAAQAESAAQQETDWKAEARKWEQRAKDNKKALDDAAPKLSEFDKLVAASQTDLERAQGEATRWQEDSQRWRNAALTSRVTTLATDFADPEDAIGALGDTSKYLTAGGDIDNKAIAADLASVLERKPHWRKAADNTPRPPAPNPAQGTAGKVAGNDPSTTFATFLQGHMAPR